MQSIVDLCKSRKLILIEDTAHAPGASVNGRLCGSWGDFGCFSFFSNKNLSVGEGGMVTTTNETFYNHLQKLRSHGMNALTLERHKGRAITYDVLEPGLNYRMDEIRAAIGLAQLEKLTSANNKRKILTDRYISNLHGSIISMPFIDMTEGHKSAYHILPVLLPSEWNRKSVINYLKELGIQTSIHYPPFGNLRLTVTCLKNQIAYLFPKFVSMNSLTSIPIYDFGRSRFCHDLITFFCLMYYDNMILDIIEENLLFEKDTKKFDQELNALVSGSSFNNRRCRFNRQAVTLEIFKRDPKVLHVLDISENNMVELVRNIRSTMGYCSETFVLTLLMLPVRNLRYFTEIKVHMTMY